MLNILVSDIVQIFGFQYHLKKKCGPNQVITYFGYELDSTLMKCTFRKEKKVQNIQFAFEQNKFNIKASSFTHILIEFCMQCSNAW